MSEWTLEQWVGAMVIWLWGTWISYKVSGGLQRNFESRILAIYSNFKLPDSYYVMPSWAVGGFWVPWSSMTRPVSRIFWNGRSMWLLDVWWRWFPCLFWAIWGGRSLIGLVILKCIITLPCWARNHWTKASDRSEMVQLQCLLVGTVRLRLQCLQSGLHTRTWIWLTSHSKRSGNDLPNSRSVAVVLSWHINP